MAEAIVDGQGSGNFWRINGSGAGIVTNVELPPEENPYNPALTLNWQVIGAGSKLVQVVKTTPAGSSVQNLSWNNDVLTGVGSWI